MAIFKYQVIRDTSVNGIFCQRGKVLEFAKAQDNINLKFIGNEEEKAKTSKKSSS